MRAFEYVNPLVSNAAQYGSLEWMTATTWLLYIQLTLSSLACYYRADYLTLTAVSLIIFQLDNIDILTKKGFRIAVAIITISLLHDLLWLTLFQQEDKIDGGIEKSMRRFSLYISWISFMVKVSHFLIF